jgi:hypothetical protein
MHDELARIPSGCTASQTASMPTSAATRPTALLVENAGGLAINGTPCFMGLAPAEPREHVSEKLGSVNEVRCPQVCHREAAQTYPRLPMSVA